VRRRKIAVRIYVRYALLMLPGTLLLALGMTAAQRWLDFPVWYIWCVLGLWLLKEAILFPFVWESYDFDRPGISRALVGERGEARQRLDPSGYIQVGGELWKAEKTPAEKVIYPGEKVRIVRRDGLRLIVERFDRL
jgi:membrane protein implicated in regulation of membrane protease activity